MWRSLSREPLVHFLLAGLALFALAEWHRRATDPTRIVIDEARLTELRHAYEAEFGSPPNASVMPRLIEDYVASEVLFREGVARGLDRNDEIVRRRVIQKVQFLEEDMALPEDPSQAQLRAWYDGHRARYANPNKISFSHIFFAADPRNEGAARARAEGVLARLSPETERAPELGDSFPDLSDFIDFSTEEARRLFGEGEMAQEPFKAPMGLWRGPWRSSFGWHLVRVSAVELGGVRSFNAAHDAVKRDYADAALAAANAKRMADLRKRYTVVRE